MPKLNREAIRERVLKHLGGHGSALEAVLRATQNRFDVTAVPPAPVFPMTDEAHVPDWSAYAAACGADAFAYLQERLVQLCVPIAAGLSASEAYADVVRRGRPFRPEAFGGKLTLDRPSELKLFVHEHAAGALPVLATPHRPDFVTLDRALAYRSEPADINPAVNAELITGLINWDRARRYRNTWTAAHWREGVAGWESELRRVTAEQPTYFYDRLVLLREAPYSGTRPAQLGLRLSDETWLAASATLRLEHEFTHYALRRLYGPAGPSLYEEAICDWAGMTAALGRFEARLLLIFFGLEDWPHVRPDGRVHAYRGGLEDEAFRLLCAVMVRAAHGLEIVERSFSPDGDRPRWLVALTRLTPELLACDDRAVLFADAYMEAGALVGAEVMPEVGAGRRFSVKGSH